MNKGNFLKFEKTVFKRFFVVAAVTTTTTTTQQQK